jgi:hypothetical protein
LSRSRTDEQHGAACDERLACAALMRAGNTGAGSPEWAEDSATRRVARAVVGA